MSAVVELHSLGFVVKWNGRPMPKTLPDELAVFKSRTWARRYAEALDADDMARCHEITTGHVRVFTVKA